MEHSESVTPVDYITILNKVYKDNAEAKAILLSHGESIYRLAEEISKKHPEYNVNLQFVKEAAYLHDIGIKFVSAPALHCNGTEKYILHGPLGADLLRTMNLEALARVAERHTGTGLTAQNVQKQNILVSTQRNMMPQTIEEKIVCYCDKFYSKTKLDQIIPYEDIKDKLSKHGDDVVQRLDMLHNMFM
ncbi:hypothetical protein EIN_371620 [Entamoeba invadens IP1]|uniref:HD domain-containing protein n=1 Tax=Entamoeba invadens IP1 TaxID=370355 RepID=A0A0A1UC01_ENTIV|nr:hypothetical protein EIN_371620 [Entamoeba invadens IP1]ELP92750.1 hypothetical protein EIN_371620 [Entamoeba invadens IP1]|eukprot:XP_004259521.1 hypothetical protein EIN_371620 [Entamoeba invadens IP1]